MKDYLSDFADAYAIQRAGALYRDIHDTDIPPVTPIIWTESLALTFSSIEMSEQNWDDDDFSIGNPVVCQRKHAISCFLRLQQDMRAGLYSDAVHLDESSSRGASVPSDGPPRFVHYVVSGRNLFVHP